MLIKGDPGVELTETVPVHPQEREEHIDSLVQDCSNPSTLAMELLHSCTKPSIFGKAIIAVSYDLATQ